MPLESIVCSGACCAVRRAEGFARRTARRLSLLSEHGRFLAGALLRREQQRRAEKDEQAAAIARSVVIAKAANCRTVLSRAAREKPDGPGAAK